MSVAEELGVSLRRYALRHGKGYQAGRSYCECDIPRRVSQGMQITGLAGNVLTGEQAGSENGFGDKEFIQALVIGYWLSPVIAPNTFTED